METGQKPRITDYTVYFNTATKNRKPYRPFTNQNTYKPTASCDDPIYMTVGLLNPVHFPAVSATFKTSDGSEITVSPEEMKSTLQYGEPRGMKTLITWLEELVKTVHSPPTLDNQSLASSLDTLLCSGGKEGLSKCVHVLLEQGDYFLSEEFVYQSLMYTCQPHGIRSFPINSDMEGMDAGHLRQAMSEWEEATQGRRPRLLYVIPTCSNPTGRTWSERRKREIYDVAREFDLLIIEDDPYYHFQVKEPVPSLLSMDEDGRVIRLDSFAKTISGGVRVGIIHGPKAVLDQLLYSVYLESGGPSRLSQMFLWKVLEHMGIDGYRKHGEMLAIFYKKRTVTMVKFMNLYLKGLVEWTPPDGGMFIWIKLQEGGNACVLLEQLRAHGLFVLDGAMFSVNMSPKPYLRLSTTQATDQQMEKGIKILAEVLREQRCGDTHCLC